MSSRDIDVAARQVGRGRRARVPHQITMRGWLDIAMRVKNALVMDHASIAAAGLALYSLLAIFPALTAVVLMYGLRRRGTRGRQTGY